MSQTGEIECVVCPSGWVELRDVSLPGQWIASDTFVECEE